VTEAAWRAARQVRAALGGLLARDGVHRIEIGAGADGVPAILVQVVDAATAAALALPATIDGVAVAAVVSAPARPQGRRPAG
jgi:hypothetical protein